jgi:TatA/E family protein of Tat protein translocase
MLNGIGPVELAILALIALVIFGAGRLPRLGRSLGTEMRAFRDVFTRDSAAESESRLALTETTQDSASRREAAGEAAPPHDGAAGHRS